MMFATERAQCAANGIKIATMNVSVDASFDTE